MSASKYDTCETCGLLKSGHTQEARATARRENLPEPCGDYHADNPQSPYASQVEVLLIDAMNRDARAKHKAEADNRPVCERTWPYDLHSWVAANSSTGDDSPGAVFENCCGGDGHGTEAEARACPRGAGMHLIFHIGPAKDRDS